MANKTDHMTAAEYQAMLKQTPKRGKTKAKWPSLPPGAIVASATTSSEAQTDNRDLITEIIIPGRVPGMNGPDGLIRMPHWKQKEIFERYQLLIRQATRNRHTPPVRIELIRHSIGRPMDYDNLVSTGKKLWDAAVACQLIPDDNPQVIQQREYSQQRAINRHTQMTVIRIIDLPLSPTNHDQDQE